MSKKQSDYGECIDKGHDMRMDVDKVADNGCYGIYATYRCRRCGYTKVNKVPWREKRALKVLKLV